MFKYAILTISMLSSVSLYSADTPYHNSDIMGSVATTAAIQDPDLLTKFEVLGFFGRPRKKKLLEGFEHCYSSYELSQILNLLLLQMQKPSQWVCSRQ
jgi:hypothetical protein